MLDEVHGPYGSFTVRLNSLSTAKFIERKGCGIHPLQGISDWTVIVYRGIRCSKVETLLSPQKAIVLTWSRYNTQKNMWLIVHGFQHQSRRTQNLCLYMHSETSQTLSSVCSCQRLLIYTRVFAHSQCTDFVQVNPSVCMREGQCIKTVPTKLCVSKLGYLWKCDICCYRDVFYPQK